ncbi:MAG: HupE/UreJ family protein [Planctomycetes bacterium]|jgi:hydrogenase/urease accessory protein HupE|nr:HupE/UreJ family protein [Planctomycetota bacterium]
MHLPPTLAVGGLLRGPAMSMLAWLLGSLLAAPHDPGLSSLRVQPAAGGLQVHVALANADFRTAAPAVDRDGDGAIDAVELAAARDSIAALVRTGFVLQDGEQPRTGELVTCALAENHDVELVLQLPATIGATAAMHVELLAGMARGHRCYAAVFGADGRLRTDALLEPRQRTLTLPPADAEASGFAQSGTFFVLGVEHILIGFDHLAFLLALLIAGTGWRRVVATITAFTVAHSITLLAAALGLVTLPGLLVEASIAGSIVVVAIANLWQRGRAAHRWPLAFGFGLVHGFGFAGVLAELEIGGPDMLLPLLTFNLGVETGQLAFAAVVVPLLAVATRHRSGRTISTVLSVLTGLAGLGWLLQRLTT